MARPRKVNPEEIAQKDPEAESSVVKRGRPKKKNQEIKSKPRTKKQEQIKKDKTVSTGFIPGEVHFLSALKSFLLGIKCLVDKNLEMFPAEKKIKNTPPKKKTKRKKVEDVTKKEE